MNDFPSSLISLSTSASPVVLLYLLTLWGTAVMAVIYLLIRSTNRSLSASDRDRAENSKELVELLIKALVQLFGRGGGR
ncbi:Na+/serine symporter [Rhodococcus sp. OAS809]